MYIRNRLKTRFRVSLKHKSGEEQNIPLSCLPLVSLSPDLHFSEDQKQGLVFVLTKLSKRNYASWRQFQDDQRTECHEIWEKLVPDNVKFESLPYKTQAYLQFINVTRPSGNAPCISAGRIAFQESLRLFEDYGSEVYVVYVLNRGNAQTLIPVAAYDSLPRESFSRVEMSLTVLTCPQACFSLHLGISRSVYHERAHWEGKLPKTRNLSMRLHAFAARVMQEKYQKSWMITRPTHEMGRILQNTLPPERLIKGDFVDEKVLRQTKTHLEILQPAGKGNGEGQMKMEDVGAIMLARMLLKGKQENSEDLKLGTEEGKGKVLQRISWNDMQENPGDWRWWTDHFYYVSQFLPKYAIDLDTLAKF